MEDGDTVLGLIQTFSSVILFGSQFIPIKCTGLDAGDGKLNNVVYFGQHIIISTKRYFHKMLYSKMYVYLFKNKQKMLKVLNQRP